MDQGRILSEVLRFYPFTALMVFGEWGWGLGYTGVFIDEIWHLVLAFGFAIFGACWSFPSFKSAITRIWIFSATWALLAALFGINWFTWKHFATGGCFEGTCSYTAGEAILGFLASFGIAVLALGLTMSGLISGAYATRDAFRSTRTDSKEPAE